MNYTSWTFWILFALVIVRYWRLSHRHQNDLLLVASYFFYGVWDYRFLFFILISTSIDYISARMSDIRIYFRDLSNLTGGAS